MKLPRLPVAEVDHTHIHVNSLTGVDFVVETCGSASATEALTSLLAFGGGLACIAGLPDFSVIHPFTKSPSIHEISLGGAHLAS